MNETSQIFNFSDNVVLQIKGLQVAVGLKILDLLDALEV